MSRGGKREGAGRKSSWKHKETQLIRVPRELASKILQYAHELDEKEFALREAAPRNSSLHQMSLLAGQYSLQASSEDVVRPMTLTQLACRLHRDKSTLSSARNRGGEYFAVWTSGRDPDGIEWEYREGERLFYPIDF